VANQLEQRQLWLALSNLFVDSEVDYKQVAGIAKNYAIKDVEFALFERVAPVCISNILVPVPPVWWYFDEEQLVADIESLVKKRARQGVMGKCLSAVARRLIRLISAKVWAELKVEIELAKRNS
jgi:hypothetical protein